MRFKKQEHNIDRQILNLNVDGNLDDSKIKELQSTMTYLYKYKIGVILDKIFSEIAPPDIHISIDHLEIDLGSIEIDDLSDMKALSRKIEANFGTQVRNQIRDKILKSNKHKFEKDGFGNIKVSKWAILESFLRDGHYPSWAGKKNQSIDKIFDELMRKSPSKVADIVLRLGKKNKKLLDRLIYQLPSRHVERLITVVYNKYGKSALKQLQTIRRRLGNRYKSMRGQKSVDKAILAAALDYAMEQVRKGKRVDYKERDFIQKIVEAIQNKYTHVSDEDIIYRSDGVKPEHSRQYSDLDVLEYFLQYGSIPYWASADSRSSIHALFDKLSNKRLVALQRMILKNIQNETFIRRLVLQFTTPQLFQLLEPIPSDQLRFLEGLLAEFQAFASKLVGLSNSQGQQAVKEAILIYLLNRSGRFQKQVLTKLALEKASTLARAPFEESLELFFGHLQQASSKAYDLTRSELLRVLNEIDPALLDKLERQVQERRVLQTEELELNRQLEDLKYQVEREGLTTPELERLKKDRKNLRKRLKKIRQRLEQLGAIAPESIRSLTEERNILERKISQINLQLQHREDEQAARTKVLDTERQQLREELKNIKVSLNRLQQKLFKDYKKAKTTQQRQKLSKEFEELLITLLKDQGRLRIRLSESNAGLQESNLTKDTINRLRRQEKRIKEDLKRIATEIATVEKVIEEIKAEVEQEAIEESLDSPSTTSQLDFLIFFLQYGSIPWWAEEYRKKSVEEIIKEFVDKQPEKIKHALARLGRNPVVWQRLVNQLKEETLEQVLIVIFPNFAGFAISAAIMLEKIKEAKIIPSIETINLLHFKWSKVTEILFTTTRSLSPSDFLKKLVIEVGKDFNIAPSQLLEYMTNLANNNPGTRLSFFADVIKPIRDDKELLEAEKDLLAAVLQRQQEEAGLILKEELKLETLEAYLAKGIFTEAAVRAKYNSQKAMGVLFLELLQKDAASIHSLLEEHLNNAQFRRRLVMELNEYAFWESVLILAPQSMPIVRSYIQDLGEALKDSNMFMAKAVLLSYIEDLGSKNFVLRDFIQAFLNEATRATERKKIAIINEWKRKIYEHGEVDSSLILSLMQNEIQDIKEQKDASIDESEKLALTQSLDSLIGEYQHQSQQMVYILNREQIEQEGLVNIPEDTKLLYEKIDTTEVEIEKLRDSINEDAKGEELIMQIMSWRQLAQLEGQLNLLKQQEPFSVRYLRIQQENLKNTLTTFQTEKENLKVPIPKLLPKLGEDQILQYFDKESLKDSALENLSIENQDKNQVLKFLDALKASTNFAELKVLEEEWIATKIIDTTFITLIQNRLQYFIYQALQALAQEQEALVQQLKNATTEKELAQLKRQLLRFELNQNDQLDYLVEQQWNANIKAVLQRSKARIREVFQYLRALADQSVQTLAQARLTELNQQIDQAAAQLEDLQKEEATLIEQLRKGEEAPSLPASLQEEVKSAPKAADKPIDEPLYVRNAGMVLLHSYFTRLFMALKMIEKGQFISEEAQIRAVHMLQYIVTGQTSHPENELVLNKIMCGLPLSTPVPMDVGLTEAELKTCDSLLQGAINNWPRLKTMTINALRGTFLVRDGSIEEEADRWKLKVEKGSFDMLLRTIPWGFTFIRYGWLDKFVMVEWEIPGN